MKPRSAPGAILLVTFVVAFAVFWLWQREPMPVSTPGLLKSTPDAADSPNQSPSTRANPDAGDPAVPGRFVSGEVLVQFGETVTREQISRSVASLDAEIIREFRRPANAYLLRLPGGKAVEEALRELSVLADVEVSEPNYIYRKAAVPDDPLFSRLWGLENTREAELDFDINAAAAWDITTGSGNVVIGVIDTGIDYTHEDLADNAWRNPGEVPGNGIDDDQNGYVDDYFGYDMINDDPDPWDDDGHGTHVAGTIAASGNNGTGSVGVMWNASIISCKFLNSEGTGTAAGAIACLNYFHDLKDDGIDVVATNNSWGGVSESNLLLNAIAGSRDRGILFVAAAGNDGVDTDVSPHYPSGYGLTNIISVTSMTREGDLSTFANYGATTVDIAAPGDGIWSTRPNNSYDALRGTSMAAPHVTGIIGLIKATNPQLTGPAIQDWLLLHATATDTFAGKMTTGAFARARLPELDQDGDGMADRWEQQYGLDPANPADSALDPDSDGLSNLEEFQNETNPLDPDSDGDGLNDGNEVVTYMTDPLHADSDRDGLGDFDEVNLHFTSPTIADSDGDDLSDFDEVIELGTNPLDVDSDADGLADGWEVRFGFDPLTGGDQTLDPDGDGLTNLGEFQAGANPLVVDTDNDGLIDGDETGVYGTDPATGDTDDDGMDDGWELRYGLDPLDAADAGADDDGDGFLNLDEYLGGTAPNNSLATPASRPWSNRNGDARQAAYAPIDTTPANIRLLWQFALDGYQHGSLTNSDGNVGFYRLTNRGAYVDAIDALTGELGWSRELLQASAIGGLRAMPGSLAVFGEQSQSISASLWLLDSETGRSIRSVAIGENRPEISAVTTDGQDFFARVSDDLARIDASTGQIVWTSELVSEAQRQITTPVAVNDSYVVAAGSNSVFVYDRMTGSFLFDRSASQCTSINENTVMIDESDRAFIIGSECAWAIDLDSRQVLWENDRDYWIEYPSMDDAYVYVIENSRLTALEKGTGAIAWQWDEDVAGGQSIVSTSTHVFVESSLGISAINKSSRLREWAHPIFGRMSISDDGLLILENQDGNGLTAFDISGDSDGDGLPDNWERRFRLDHLDSGDASLDFDNDGLSNADEFANGSNPTKRDSDGDGLSDFEEANVFGTSASNADTDLDGLSDGNEVLVYQTNPAFADTDRDGFLDGDEANDYSSDPADATSQPPLIVDRTESFESGIPADWSASPFSQGDWLVDSAEASDGGFSLSTSTVASGFRAIVEWTAEFADGDLYFDARVVQSSFASRIEVYVDDDFILDIDSAEWQRRGLHLTQGEHTIRFEYRYGHPGNGIAYLDNFEFETLPPLASDTNRFLALDDEQIWEVDLDGGLSRLPIRIPGAETSFEIAVDHLHRVVVPDRPYLHYYDPLTRRFTRKFVGQWESGVFVPFERGIVLASSSGIGGELILLDHDGKYTDHSEIGRAYIDLEVGPEGMLYALRFQDPVIDRIDLDTLSLVDSIPAPELAREIAVDTDGFIYVKSHPAEIGKYDPNGVLVAANDESDSFPGDGPVVTSNGIIVFGRNDASMLLTSTNLAPLARKALVAPAFLPDFSFRDLTFAAIDPTGLDSDADGIADWWEYARNLDPFDPANVILDADADGLDTLAEYLNRTDPNNPDSDGDGLGDGAEVNVHASNPLSVDSDSDTISDYDEVVVHMTDPTLQDTDDDGVTDAEELFTTGSDPLSADTDNDGMDDGWERVNGLDLLSPADAGLDPDGDQLSNLEEFNVGTEIRVADTDADGLNDGDEVNAFLTDPLDRDTDSDWLYDGWEAQYGFDPRLLGDDGSDPDADGFSNREEFFAGTDPLNPALIPLVRDWSMHQGNSAHTGYVPIDVDPARYEKAWSNSTIADVHTLSAPAIAADAVAISVKDIFNNQFLYALDADDGFIRWSAALADTDALSPPTAFGGSIFVQSAGFTSGAMHKFDLQSGTMVFETPYAYRGMPVLAPTEYDGNLYAFDGVDTGVASFRTDTASLNWFNSVPTGVGWAAAVDSSAVYVLSAQGLAVLDRESGETEYLIGHPPGLDSIGAKNSTIVNRFGEVFVVANGHLIAYDTVGRKLSWNRNGGGYERFASYAAGTVYAIESGGIVAIDSRDGSVMWRWAGSTAVRSSILVTLHHLYVSTNSRIVVLDRHTGQEAWEISGGGELAMDASGTLYVSGYDGSVSAYRVSADRDGDGMPDAWESLYGLDADNPTDANIDLDGDGLSNLDEFRAGTDPNQVDTDSDGLSDDGELQTFLTDPTLPDSDGDGLDDGVEVNSSLTDPLDPDTDADRLSDGQEVNVHLTDPFSGDSDGDGIGDFEEVQTGSNPADGTSTPVVLTRFTESFESGSLPLGWSVPLYGEFGWQVTPGAAYDGSFALRSDMLGYPSSASIEFTGNFSPGYLTYFAGPNAHGCCAEISAFLDDELVRRSTSSDWDFRIIGIPAGIHTIRWEFVIDAADSRISRSGLLDVISYVPDRDGDQMEDTWEISFGLDPDNFLDGTTDPDMDDLPNQSEFVFNTSPINPDSDLDGMLDGYEVQYNLDPNDPADAAGDPDGDGLDNATEAGLGTSPKSQDSDGDGMPDPWEAANGLNATAYDSDQDPDGDGFDNLTEYTNGTDPRVAEGSGPSPPQPPTPTPLGSNSGGGGGSTGPYCLLLLLALIPFRRRSREHYERTRSISSPG